MTISIMGQPGSVWRLINCLWNLCARYLSGFLKADLVGRLSVNVRRLVITQKRKQGLAIKNDVGNATPITIPVLRNGMSSGTKIGLECDKPTSRTKAWQRVRFPSGCPTLLYKEIKWQQIKPINLCLIF